MSSEIPEIFKALLEYPFSLPSIDDNGKNVSMFAKYIMHTVGIQVKWRLAIYPYFHCVHKAVCTGRNWYSAALCL